MTLSDYFIGDIKRYFINNIKRRYKKFCSPNFTVNILQLNILQPSILQQKFCMLSIRSKSIIKNKYFAEEKLC